MVMSHDPRPRARPGTVTNLHRWNSSLDQAAESWAASKSSSVHVDVTASRAALTETMHPRDLMLKWREQRRKARAPQDEDDDLGARLAGIVRTFSLMDNDPCPPVEANFEAM